MKTELRPYRGAPLADAHRRGADIQREDRAGPELRREHHRDGADFAEDHPRRHQGGLPENPDAGVAQEETPRPLERAGGDAPRRHPVLVYYESFVSSMLNQNASNTSEGRVLPPLQPYRKANHFRSVDGLAQNMQQSNLVTASPF